MDIAKVAQIHGRTMYLQGLEHAINMFEIAGEDALKLLKERLETEKTELREIEAESCND